MGKWLDKDGLIDLKTRIKTKVDTKVDKYTEESAGKFLQTDANGNAVWGTAASPSAVAAAAEQWMEDNTSAGVTLAIDSSLTREGFAADAKATGDLVKSAATQPSTSGTNVLWINESSETEYQVPTQAEFDDLKSAFENFEDTAEKRIDGDTHSATINGTTGIVGNSSAAVVYVFEIEDEVYTLSFHGGNVRRYGFSNSPFAIGVTVNDLKTKSGSVILDDNREIINNTNGYKYLYAMATSNKSNYPGSLELLKRTDFVTNKTLNELIEQKNIINFNALLEQGWSREANGITVSLNTNGSFHVSGTATQNGNVLIINETYLNQIIEDGRSYFLTGTPYGSDCYVRYYQDDSQGIYSDRDGSGIQFTGKANVNKNITIYTLEGTTVDFDMFIQVNEGDIFDYYESPNGTPIDIVARANKTMNIVPIMISRVFREDVIPGYRFQSIAYDTDKSVFYIGCSSKEKNGQSLILVSDNLFNLYDADQYAVIAGHINDMTYDHVNQRLLAVSGKNEDGVAENPPGGNTVIVIETTNMTVTDVVTLNELEYAISICSGDNVIYVYNLYAIYTYDTNFNLLYVSRNLYSSKIGQELRQLTHDQGMFWDGEYIYKVYNDSREIQPRANAVLGRINPNGFYFDKVIVAPINTGAETQGIVSVDGNLYILCDGVFGSVSIARVAENLIAPKPTRIPENTDLNKLLAFGKWFCPSSSVCNTLLNLPPNEGIEHSFSLTIEEQGASWVRQTITVSSGTDTLYCAYYTRVCKNDGVWLPWVKFTGSILTT